jgi:hypothetical protein
MELEDLEVNFYVQPIRNRGAAVGCGFESILRHGFDCLLVEAEGRVSFLLRHGISDRLRNVYVGSGAVGADDERDHAVASNLFLSRFFGEFWLDGVDELRRRNSVSSVIDAEEVWIGE